MNSSLISKIEKSRRYAEEPERVKFKSFVVEFQGNNDTYTTSMDGTEFSCTCHFFAVQGMGTCAHVMAMQRMLHDMLTEEQQTAGAPVSLSSL